MKVATYNIWNSDYYFSERMAAITNEIEQLSPDLIALQEVRPDAMEYILKDQSYYSIFEKYTDENEGLAILSKSPIRHSNVNWETEDIENCSALFAEIQVNHLHVLFCTVHFDYQSIARRERQSVQLCKRINQVNADLFIMCGDFNSDTNSSIYRFLTGQQTLFGTEESWIHAIKQGNKHSHGLEPTLDFETNSRWRGSRSLETPVCCDWIMVKTKSMMDLQHYCISDSGLFGKKEIQSLAIHPSDHYGVFSILNGKGFN